MAERLARFRAAHPSTRRRLAGETLEYIRCGEGERTLLLLTGLLGRGESWFPLIERLERHYRILSPTYAGSPGWAELVQTLVAMLDVEGVTRADLVGQSFGGLVAQGLVREQPGRVRSMTLSHTPSSGPTSRVWLACWSSYWRRCLFRCNGLCCDARSPASQRRPRCRSRPEPSGRPIAMNFS